MSSADADGDRVSGEGVSEPPAGGVEQRDAGDRRRDGASAMLKPLERLPRDLQPQVPRPMSTCVVDGGRQCACERRSQMEGVSVRVSGGPGLISIYLSIYRSIYLSIYHLSIYLIRARRGLPPRPARVGATIREGTARVTAGALRVRGLRAEGVGLVCTYQLERSCRRS